jgi:prepilin-type processing-associated H-X9-DG protein/prepilin-type N-terminal cleavage/methylation domain-containing protein
MQHGGHATGSRAFTLVELLVVIGIIAVLIGVLLPALVSARRSADTLVCATNMRQIGIGIYRYANDNHDYLPIGHFHTGIPLYDRSWDELIHRDLGGTLPDDQLDQQLFTNQNMRVLKCPADAYVRAVGFYPRSYAMVSVGVTAGVVGLNEPHFLGTAGGQYYGGAYFTIPSPFAIKRVMVRKPSTTLLLVEAHKTYNVAGGQQEFYVSATYHQFDNPAKPVFPHKGKFNYLFADGHVALLAQNETTGTSTVPTIFLPNPAGAWTRDPND